MKTTTRLSSLRESAGFPSFLIDVEPFEALRKGSSRSFVLHVCCLACALCLLRITCPFQFHEARRGHFSSKGWLPDRCQGAETTEAEPPCGCSASSRRSAFPARSSHTARDILESQIIMGPLLHCSRVPSPESHPVCLPLAADGSCLSPKKPSSDAASLLVELAVV